MSDLTKSVKQQLDDALARLKATDLPEERLSILMEVRVLMEELQRRTREYRQDSC